MSTELLLGLVALACAVVGVLMLRHALGSWPHAKSQPIEVTLRSAPDSSLREVISTLRSERDSLRTERDAYAAQCAALRRELDEARRPRPMRRRPAHLRVVRGPYAPGTDTDEPRTTPRSAS